MFIELIGSLRCLRPHEESWLVGAFHRTEARAIVDGLLGCPVCGAEYPVEGGVTHFGTPDAPGARLPAGFFDERAGGDPAEQGMRLAAMLDLVDDGGAVLLAGAWGRASSALASLAQVAQLVANAPADVRGGGPVSLLRVRDAAPFAAASLRGAALDATPASTALPLASLVRALRLRARLLAPAVLAVPEGITELARDAEWWVGERTVSPQLVALGRR